MQPVRQPSLVSPLALSDVLICYKLSQDILASFVKGRHIIINRFMHLKTGFMHLNM